MSAEFAIQLDCPVRRAESDDLAEATASLRRQVKAGSMLEIMKSIARRQGKLPFEISMQHRVQTGAGVETREVDWHTIKAQVDGFEAKCGACAACPVNLLGRPFGCSGALKYPITEAVERWVCERVQPPDTVGGLFLASAVADLGYDGAPMASWRTREDLFDRRTPVVCPFGDGEISADQIFHAIFAVGPELNPEHCLMVLVWLGLVAIDGAVLGGPADAATLQAVSQCPPGDARRARARFADQAPTEGMDVTEIRTLFAAMFAAWCAGVPLWIDA